MQQRGGAGAGGRPGAGMMGPGGMPDMSKLSPGQLAQMQVRTLVLLRAPPFTDRLWFL